MSTLTQFRCGAESKPAFPPASMCVLSLAMAAFPLVGSYTRAREASACAGTVLTHWSEFHTTITLFRCSAEPEPTQVFALLGNGSLPHSGELLGN